MQTLIVSDEHPWGRTGGSKRLALMCQILAGLGPVDLLLIPPGNKAHRPSRPLEIPMRDNRHLIGTADGDDETGGSFFNEVHMITRDALENACATDRSQLIRESIEHEIIRTEGGLSQLLGEHIAGRSYDLAWYNRERIWLITRRIVNARAASTIVDIDDLEDVMLGRWLDIGKNEHGEPITESERTRLARDIVFWRKVHEQVASEAGAVLLSSGNDHSRVSFGNSVIVPNSYTPSRADGDIRETPSAPTVLFQGWLRWPANEDAAAWLVEQIAPRVRKHVPDLQVILVGDASTRVHEMSKIPGVHVTGEVPSMSPYLRAAHVVAVPLRVGGGTRIKILEAFANRIPVVATTIGAEGIEAIPGIHLELADTTADMVRCCVQLLTSASARERMADAAFQLYDDRYRPVRAKEAVHRAIRMAVGRSACGAKGAPQ